MSVEIKSRVTVNTIKEALSRLKQHVGLNEWDEGEIYMFSLAALDLMLSLLIGNSLHPLCGQKELFQLLHHAFCYGVQET